MAVLAVVYASQHPINGDRGARPPTFKGDPGKLRHHTPENSGTIPQGKLRHHTPAETTWAHGPRLARKPHNVVLAAGVAVVREAPREDAGACRPPAEPRCGSATQSQEPCQRKRDDPRSAGAVERTAIWADGLHGTRRRQRGQRSAIGHPVDLGGRDRKRAARRD